MANELILETLEELEMCLERVKQFGPIHNGYKDDALLLVERMDESLDSIGKYQSYYRSAIMVFFSIIEADMFYLNQFDKYHKYHDKHSFKEKFESTFPKVCASTDKVKLQEDYFRDNLDIINKLRDIRNKLAHPKDTEHLFKASKEDAAELKTAIINYTEFINKLMYNFFLQYRVKPEEYSRAMEILRKHNGTLVY